MLSPITGRCDGGEGLLPVSDKPYKMLFLCTGNSARSIMAEVLLNHLGHRRFTAYSAGSHPKGAVHPLAIETLQRMGLPTDGLRSKSWEEFARPDAPVLDMIVTVCDEAAGEVCPVWPAKPMLAHWGVEDPAAFQWHCGRTTPEVPRGGAAAEAAHRAVPAPAPGHPRQNGAASRDARHRAGGMMSLPRRVVAEGLGTAFLLAVVIGSGIMGERLSGGNVAIALLANSLATGGGLVVLILIFGPVSGAHFNPAVTLAAATQGVLPWREVLPYIAIQVLGAFAGVAAAHLMFGEPLFFASLKVRTSGAQWWSEFIATFGLLMVIWGCVRQNITAVPYAVAAYITSAYWFTASTSFANPAVTLARAASNTFAGIRPEDVAAFILAQLLGAAAATVLFRWLLPLPKSL